uniref:Uncharacterized protein n=1 Tax=Rhizophora mucronata TaxID=61149 RepID=A0A2P2Q7W4_RHIMU
MLVRFCIRKKKKKNDTILVNLPIKMVYKHKWQSTMMSTC